MRLTGLISLLLFSVIYCSADHLMGGEISYEHLSGTRFKVHVTLYRDCNGSKMGGTGGGTSSSNHLDLKYVHIQSGSNSNCGNSNQYLGKINLVKSGYENITAVCSGVNTACNTNPSYNYGIEAHRYTGTVDFDQYSSFSGCELKLYVSLSDRSDDYTTLYGGTNFYNYAIINPWISQVSSPSFTKDPTFLYNKNKPVYLNPLVRANEGDSLSYHWAQPYKADNDPLEYQTGFSYTKFITAYCPTGSDCTPNPSAGIPEGIYFNNTTGDYVFTPVASSQIGNMVLEIEQWRSVNGLMIRTGLIRRDIMIAVVLDEMNNPPVIQANETYEVCVGESLNLNIAVSDAQTVLSDGTTLDYDSVRFIVSSSNTAIRDSIYYVSQHPYRMLNIQIDATESLVGEHWVMIEARDNHCPTYARSMKRIRIVVNPLPEVDLTIDDLFCGNNKLTVQSDQAGSASLSVFEGNERVFLQNEFSELIYTNFEVATLLYRVNYVSGSGCSVIVEKEIDNTGNSTIEDAKLIGDTAYCEGELLNIKLRHGDFGFDHIQWKANGFVVSGDTAVNISAFNGELSVYYKLIHNGLHCAKSDATTLILNELPVLSTDPIADLCYSQKKLDLSAVQCQPSGGYWTSDLNVDNGIVNFNQIPNEDRSYDLTYHYEDPLTGCSSSLIKSISVLKSPEMKLNDVVMCGANNVYRLNNSILLPAHFTPENITWEHPGYTGTISGVHPSAELDVPSLGVGIYTIVAVNKAENGCIARDTGWLKVNEGLTITSNGNNQICESSEPIDLVEYMGINAPGGMFYSADAFNMLNYNILTPVNCGEYEFQYTYDAFGCFAQETFNINIVCKPDISTNIPDTLCINSSAIELETNLTGNWSGSGVNNNIFNPQSLTGKQLLTFNTMPLSGCVFSATDSIEVLDAASLSLSVLPESLCEGENLNFSLIQDPNSKLTFKYCPTSEILRIPDDAYSYRTSACDLDRGNIQISIEAAINSLCPAANVLIEVPYHRLPLYAAPPKINECNPYSLDIELNPIQGLDPFVEWEIANDIVGYVGQGSHMHFNFNESNVYDIILKSTDVTGCENVQTFDNWITIHPKPEASFDLSHTGYINLSDREIYLYNYSEIERGTMDYSWYYITNGKATYFSNLVNPYLELPLDTGRYRIMLEVNSDQYCKDTASKDLILVPDILVFIPNAFTPDQLGPEQNNAFKIISVNTAEFHLRIYNKWGQMVYESHNIDEEWDGTYGDHPCQTGVYIYRLDIVNHSGLPFRYNGTVNLIR